MRSWRAAAVLCLLAGCDGLHKGSWDASVLDGGGGGGGPGCNPGFHGCAGACVSDDSIDQCGMACRQCPQPAGAQASCTLGACELLCPMPLFKCGDTCCKAVAVTAGAEHSCLLTELGTVKCWGYAAGIGSGSPLTVRLVSGDVDVGGDSGVVQLTSSYFNTCARLENGALRCWGNNANGSIGDGTNLPRFYPTQVIAADVRDVTYGAFFGCAVIGEGVKCWGAAMNGTLGNGSLSDHNSPGQVSGLQTGVDAVWSGYNTACARTDAGFWCWGTNGSGEAGDLTKVNPLSTPVLVKTGDGGQFLEIHPSASTSCGLTTNHGVKCWGLNSEGQLGSGAVTGPQIAGVDALGLTSGVGQLASSSSGYHFCALTDGGAYCWGLNDKGQIGDGTVLSKSQPTAVMGLQSGVRQIALGEHHTCAVLLSGGVKCWGHNNEGQLGDGTKSDSFVPVDVR